MELSNLLSAAPSISPLQTPDTAHLFHQYNTRTTMSSNIHNGDGRLTTPPAIYADGDVKTPAPYTGVSPYSAPAPRSVAFELLFPESPHYRARLPMRVQIYQHDTTESIVTTVKNFYGLYASTKGVSFEDVHGNTLIAHYENLSHNMTVYVRVIDEPTQSPDGYEQAYHPRANAPHQPYSLEDMHQMPPPHPTQALSYGQSQSRPMSRASHKRSDSPNSGRGRRSASASTVPTLPMKKPRSRSGYKSRGSSTHGSFVELHSDGLNGYSSGDGGAGSVSSKSRSEHLGNTEISLDNIVEGGRRKRAKFESSELPLFAPPQMPAATSNSSVSPARRQDYQPSSFPFAHPSQNPFSQPPPLQSPQSYNNGFGQPGMYTTPVAQAGRRTRGTGPYHQGRGSFSATPTSNGSGILPTPDPTVGSCVSEEDKDVALQLMRLGEMSNISHGRTSASTLDDTFSGRADAASSTGATSDGGSESEVELPPTRRQKLEFSPVIAPSQIKRFPKHLEDGLPSQDSTEPSGDEADYGDGFDGTFRPDMPSDVIETGIMGKPKLPKTKSTSQAPPAKPRATSISKGGKGSKAGKTQRSLPAIKNRGKTTNGATGVRAPISPTSLPSQSRKTSVASALNFQHQLGEGEEDLSSKPRCQRCRKSKKGCDRQRPCQRCKDAGLSADQCVSEDEGNGRKGRYGRHMGVAVKKEDAALQSGVQSALLTAGMGSPEKGKKRKR